MSLTSRLLNVFRTRELHSDIDEELRSHIEEAIELGRAPEEATRAFGSLLRHREVINDIKLARWLGSLRADAAFGWRQLSKNKITTAVAILSLGLGIGSCLSAFRLIDALFLRSLPVKNPDRIFEVYRRQMGFDFKPTIFDGWAYPAFKRMRSSVKDQAELIAISYAEKAEVIGNSDQETEEAYIQYVSGWMFATFGLKPAVGRLLMEQDDMLPSVNAYTVLSYSYWTRRFARDPRVIGRTIRVFNRIFQVVGVSEQGFTGTEPGTVVDLFLPAAMNTAVTLSDSTWHRTLATLKPGAAVEPVRQRLNAVSLAFERERAKGFTNMSEKSVANYLQQNVEMAPASSGISDMQQSNKRALTALAVLVALVLFIASLNVANLSLAQGAARAREMALRVSIGAGRARLVQLLLVESAMLGAASAFSGMLFALWSAPFVVRMMSSSDNPVQLFLPLDWRLCACAAALTVAVTLIFGLAPAVRAGMVAPVQALKGGVYPRSGRRFMHSLIAVQAAFCFLVLFVGGMFVATFERLAHQPTGFSSDRLLTVDTVSRNGQPATIWNQLTQHLRSVPGVQDVALAGFSLLSGQGRNNSVSIHGGPPSDTLTYLLAASPGWLNVMKIPLISGRDFRASDLYPGSAIVNETFVKTYLNGENPLGQTFDEVIDQGPRLHLQIVGVARDARYRSLRDSIPPIAYVPFHVIDAKGVDAQPDAATLLIQSYAANPLSVASTMRAEIQRFGYGFRVTNMRTQQEINDVLTTRERLTAALAVFFSAISLLLAGIGLYGVLSYSVLQRKREIGIRTALGARSEAIAYLVTADVSWMLLAGTCVGLVSGIISFRYIQPLLFQVQLTDLAILGWPSGLVLCAACLVAAPAVVRAVRLDPAAVLREQ